MAPLQKVRHQKSLPFLTQTCIFFLLFYYICICHITHPEKSPLILDSCVHGVATAKNGGNNTVGTEKDQHGDEMKRTREMSDLFNPFRDIRLSLDHHNDLNRQNLYSSYHCVSAVGANDHPDEVRFLSRTCKFTNLYYTPKDATFHYFPSPAEISLYKNNETALRILEEDMTVSIGHVLQKDSKSIDTVPPFTKWSPMVHVNDSLPNNFARTITPEKPVFLLYHPFYSNNFGHLLWDDILGLYSMLDSFSMITNDFLSQSEREYETLIPLMVEFAGQDTYFRCQATLPGVVMASRWGQCAKMYRKTFPSLLRYETHRTGDILRTNTWLRGMDMVGYWNNEKSQQEQEEEMEWNQMLPETSHVLIRTALAGMGRLGQMSCVADCTIGRAGQFASFREFLLRNIFWPEYKHDDWKKPAGYITFSLPVGSSRPTAVTFFENIIPVAQSMYGMDRVKVVNFSNMTVREQASLAMNTAVMFSYHGGGSATSIFLPKDASLLLHATVGRCTDKSERGYVWCDRGRNHFDAVFYNSDSYIRTTWVNPEDRYNTKRTKTLLEIEYQKTMTAWGRFG